MHRQRLDLSQDGLADCVGVAQDTISKWERGRTSASVPELMVLCDLFGVSADYMIGRSDHESGLRPGMFLVDMDAADKPVELEDLAVQIPLRPAIRTWEEVKRMYRRGVKKINKGRKKP